MLLSKGASMPQRQIQTLNDREVYIDFSNLLLAQYRDFKCPNQSWIMDLFYFEQKILLCLTNLRLHSLNILKVFPPYSTCIFVTAKQLSFITLNWRQKSVHGHSLENLYGYAQLRLLSQYLPINISRTQSQFNFVQYTRSEHH